MKKIYALISILVLALTACTKDDAEIVMDDIMPSITVVYSISGPGDNGYNDKMVEGVVHFCDSTNVALHTIRPASIAEAKSIVDKWITDTQGRATRSMMILAGNEYSELASAIKPIEDKNRCLLLVESDEKNMPKGVVTACVDRKSVMYLAGALSARTPACIMAAMKGDKMVEMATKAFSDGYEAKAQGHKVEEIHYLSENEEGYTVPNIAYAYTDGLIKNRDKYIESTADYYNTRFILLPMAGGSNTGVYFYMMQSYSDQRSYQAVIGMDADYSGRLEMSPFSIVISVDKMMEDCISTWLKGKSLPAHRTYSMDEGFADVVMNPSFDFMGVYAMQEFADVDGNSSLGQLPENYWTEKYEEYKSEALEYGKKSEK